MPSSVLGLCENFLYGFKAARRAARAANSARSPLLPLALPQRRRLAPVGWREKHKTSGHIQQSSEVQLSNGKPGLAAIGSRCAPELGIVRHGQNLSRAPTASAPPIFDS